MAVGHRKATDAGPASQEEPREEPREGCGQGPSGGHHTAHCSLLPPRRSWVADRHRQGPEPPGHCWAPDMGRSWDSSPCSAPSQDGQSWRRCGAHPACGERETREGAGSSGGEADTPLCRTSGGSHHRSRGNEPRTVPGTQQAPARRSLLPATAAAAEPGRATGCARTGVRAPHTRPGVPLRSL